jgi:hypothetical protein
MAYFHGIAGWDFLKRERADPLRFRSGSGTSSKTAAACLLSPRGYARTTRAKLIVMLAIGLRAANYMKLVSQAMFHSARLAGKCTR